jgi:acetoin utilization protein AcuB
MHTPVTTVPPDTLVRTAYQVMHDTRMRHLPVVTDEGTLVGIITGRDIRRAAASDVPHLAEHELLSLLDKLRVRDIMTPEVVTVSGTTPLREAGQLLLEHKFGCLPVVHVNHTLAGIITVTDLLRASMDQDEAGRQMRVRSVMQTQMVTVTPEMSLAEAQRLLRDHHIRHLPVVATRVAIAHTQAEWKALPTDAKTQEHLLEIITSIFAVPIGRTRRDQPFDRVGLLRIGPIERDGRRILMEPWGRDGIHR